MLGAIGRACPDETSYPLNGSSSRLSRHSGSSPGTLLLASRSPDLSGVFSLSWSNAAWISHRPSRSHRSDPTDNAARPNRLEMKLFYMGNYDGLNWVYTNNLA